MNRSKSALALISIGVLTILLAPYAVTASPAVYKVWVDDYYGFYQVRNIEPGNITFKYENNTLNIKAGDNVIWENQAYDNSELTLLSEQNLWDNRSGYMRYNYDTFNYTFMQPGTYLISIKEEPRIRRQTIVVAPVETTTVATPSPTQTLTATATTVVSTSVTQAPEEKAPGLNLWYILLALLVVAGIVALIYLQKKK